MIIFITFGNLNIKNTDSKSYLFNLKGTVIICLALHHEGHTVLCRTGIYGRSDSYLLQRTLFNAKS